MMVDQDEIRESFSAGDEVVGIEELFSREHTIGADEQETDMDFDDQETVPPQEGYTADEHNEGEGENVQEESDASSSPSVSMATSRPARTRVWPKRSDPHPRFPSLQQRRQEMRNAVRTIGTGADSGRNLLAIFQDVDEEPRLAFNIRLIGDKKNPDKRKWPDYPRAQDIVLNVGISLQEVLAHYPNHAWNDGLRIFNVEGWTAERMWRMLPIDARHSTCSGRPWNYLQQALGREADEVYKESTGRRRVIRKRIPRTTAQANDTSDVSDAIVQDLPATASQSDPMELDATVSDLEGGQSIAGSGTGDLRTRGGIGSHVGSGGLAYQTWSTQNPLSTFSRGGMASTNRDLGRHSSTPVSSNLSLATCIPDLRHQRSASLYFGHHQTLSPRINRSNPNLRSSPDTMNQFPQQGVSNLRMTPNTQQPYYGYPAMPPFMQPYPGLPSLPGIEATMPLNSYATPMLREMTVPGSSYRAARNASLYTEGSSSQAYTPYLPPQPNLRRYGSYGADDRQSLAPAVSPMAMQTPVFGERPAQTSQSQQSPRTRFPREGNPDVQSHLEHARAQNEPIQHPAGHQHRQRRFLRPTPLTTEQQTQLRMQWRAQQLQQLQQGQVHTSLTRPHVPSPYNRSSAQNAAVGSHASIQQPLLQQRAQEARTVHRGGSAINDHPSQRGFESSVAFRATSMDQGRQNVAGVFGIAGIAAAGSMSGRIGRNSFDDEFEEMDRRQSLTRADQSPEDTMLVASGQPTDNGHSDVKDDSQLEIEGLFRDQQYNQQSGSEGSPVSVASSSQSSHKRKRCSESGSTPAKRSRAERAAEKEAERARLAAERKASEPPVTPEQDSRLRRTAQVEAKLAGLAKNEKLSLPDLRFYVRDGEVLSIRQQFEELFPWIKSCSDDKIREFWVHNRDMFRGAHNRLLEEQRTDKDGKRQQKRRERDGKV